MGPLGNRKEQAASRARSLPQCGLWVRTAGPQSREGANQTPFLGVNAAQGGRRRHASLGCVCAATGAARLHRTWRATRR
eukprot:7170742-Prymnesium_polylepis.1